MHDPPDRAEHRTPAASASARRGDRDARVVHEVKAVGRGECAAPSKGEIAHPASVPLLALEIVEDWFADAQRKICDDDEPVSDRAFVIVIVIPASQRTAQGAVMFNVATVLPAELKSYVPPEVLAPSPIVL
jgi:hypothetical protein